MQGNDLSRQADQSEMAQLGLGGGTVDKEFLWSLIECLQEGVYAVSQEKFILVNSALCDLLGYSREELIGKPFVDVIDKSSQSLVLERSRARLDGEAPPNHYEIDVRRCDGVVLTAQIKVSTFQLKDYGLVNVGSIRDISGEKQMLKQLRQSEQEFRRIVENLPDLFYRTDCEGKIIMASPYAANVLGYQLDELIGRSLADFYAKPEERQATLEKIIAGNGQMVPVESCLRHRDGSILWVSTHACARYDEEGQLAGVEGVARNITQHKQMQERLRSMAIRDPLTQVFNRFGFDECLSAAINRARRNQSEIALLFFDLDKFKAINDNHGHDVGDRYLAAFAKRLEIGFRDTDTVARIGGDEFIVLLENIEGSSSVYTLLERCITALSDPFADKKNELKFNYSYGIAKYPQHGSDAGSLLKYADEAMYRDKKQK